MKHNKSIKKTQKKKKRKQNKTSKFKNTHTHTHTRKSAKTQKREINISATTDLKRQRDRGQFAVKTLLLGLGLHFDIFHSIRINADRLLHEPPPVVALRRKHTSHTLLPCSGNYTLNKQREWCHKVPSVVLLKVEPILVVSRGM